MMKLFKSKKRVVAVTASAGLVLGVAGGAFAYFTSTGSGTGTGTVGTNTSVTVKNISFSGLTPGGPAQPVVYSFDNPAANGVQNFGKASVAVDSITPSTCTSTATTDFAVAQSTGAVGTVGAGATYNSVTASEPTVAMNNLSTSQDDCQNAVVHVTVTIAQGS